jgi:hypothetical protein
MSWKRKWLLRSSPRWHSVMLEIQTSNPIQKEPREEVVFHQLLAFELRIEVPLLEWGTSPDQRCKTYPAREHGYSSRQRICHTYFKILYYNFISFLIGLNFNTLLLFSNIYLVCLALFGCSLVL